jgi:hypothetical protein
MFSRWPDYPPIGTDHLLDARLFASREDLVRALPVRKHGKIAEIGVWQGAFSKVLATRLAPGRFLAFDIFTGHLETDWNGMTGEQLFDGLTHREYYEKEMAAFCDAVTIVQGPNPETLRRHADRSFDLVYVDAAHHYDPVKADAELAAEMVADAGFLLFDDYTLLDPGNNAEYGVVPVVNDLVVNRGWRVVAYALNQHLYCNIALCRAGSTAARQWQRRNATPRRVSAPARSAPAGSDAVAGGVRRRAPVR